MSVVPIDPVDALAVCAEDLDLHKMLPTVSSWRHDRRYRCGTVGAEWRPFQVGDRVVQNSWAQTFFEGVFGAFLGSAVSVLVAVYAIRRTQLSERYNRRENLSLAAAERLTEALLEARQKLAMLSTTTVAQSRTFRVDMMAVLVKELEIAVQLQAPVLTPEAFSELPDRIEQALGTLHAAIVRREDAVMHHERLGEAEDDRAYAVDREASNLRRKLDGFLKDVITALTSYRRGGVMTVDSLPPIPVVPVNASAGANARMPGH